MVVNNQEPESGGKEGLLALVAIAVVLFFVIRIYSDYVTRTGQAVKPRSEQTARKSYPPKYGSPEEDPFDAPRRPAPDYDEGADQAPSPPAAQRYPADVAEGRRRSYPPEYQNSAPSGGSQVYNDRYPDDVTIDRNGHYVPRDQGAGGSVRTGSYRDWSAGEISVGRARDPGTVYHSGSRSLRHTMPRDYAGQIVVGRAPLPRREPQYEVPAVGIQPVGQPPRPRPIDSAVARDTFGAPTFRTASVRTTALFRAPNPYPGTYDDIQIGDPLSEINRLDLPGGHLSRSVYVYHPIEGPFKTIYALLAAGSSEPEVTSMVYVFRNARSRATVERQAIDAFGEGSSDEGRGDRRLWRHLEGYSVAMEPDRYSVNEDNAPEVRRSVRRAASLEQ